MAIYSTLLHLEIFNGTIYAFNDVAQMIVAHSTSRFKRDG
jgi:hypothetical protein